MNECKVWIVETPGTRRVPPAAAVIPDRLTLSETQCDPSRTFLRKAGAIGTSVSRWLAEPDGPPLTRWRLLIIAAAIALQAIGHAAHLGQSLHRPVVAVADTLPADPVVRLTTDFREARAAARREGNPYLVEIVHAGAYVVHDDDDNDGVVDLDEQVVVRSLNGAAFEADQAGRRLLFPHDAPILESAVGLQLIDGAGQTRRISVLPTGQIVRLDPAQEARS